MHQCCEAGTATARARARRARRARAANNVWGGDCESEGLRERGERGRCSLLRLLLRLNTGVHHSAHLSFRAAFATPAVRGGAIFELHWVPANIDPAKFVDRGNVGFSVNVFVERLF